MSDWFTSTWPTLAWVAGGTAALYLSSLIAIRIAGRRTLAQMAAFDFLVTVALGSIIATTAVSEEPPVANGIVAILTLLSLQVIVGALRQRSERLEEALDFPPIVLYDGDELDLPTSPLKAQPTREEIESRLRRQGVERWDEVERVVLEPDGKVSVLLRDEEQTV